LRLTPPTRTKQMFPPMRRASSPLVLLCLLAPIGAAGAPTPPAPKPNADAPKPAADAPPSEKPQFADRDVAVRAYVDPPRVLLGDVFHLVVEVRHPAGHKVVLPGTLTWGKLESAGPVQRDVKDDGQRTAHGKAPLDSVVETFRFPLQAFQLGAMETPSMQLKIPGLNVEDDALLLDGLPVNVEKLTKPDEKAEQAPMAPAVPVMRKDPRFLVWPPLLLLTGLLWALVWWLDRRRPAAVVAAQAMVPRMVVPPFRVALDQIEALRRAGLLEKGKTAQFVETASQIARQYLESSYAVPVLEQTTEEAVAALGPAVVAMVARPEQRRLGRLNMDLVRSVLSFADQVKFAKGVAQVNDCAALLDNVVQLVETTRPLGNPSSENAPAQAAGV